MYRLQRQTFSSDFLLPIPTLCWALEEAHPINIPNKKISLETVRVPKTSKKFVGQLYSKFTGQ
jgi:hypothetical protein